MIMISVRIFASLFCDKHVDNLNKVLFNDHYFKDAEQENMKENSFIMTTAAYVHELNILKDNFELYLPSCPFHLQIIIFLMFNDPF